MTATCPLHPECTIGLLHHNCMLPHIGIFHRNHNISQEFDVAAEMLGTCVRLAKGLIKSGARVLGTTRAIARSLRSCPAAERW